MLSAFRHTISPFKVVMHNITCARVEDALKVPDFDWGDNVELLREWASSIKLLNRPTRKSAPKYLQPQPATPAKKNRPASTGLPISPSQVGTWYAAKNTSRPGAYLYKDVPESYNRDNKGTIKQFSSLAAVRKWLQMPAPRTYTETECFKDATDESVAEEFFAVKGGSNAGVYRTMAKAIKAKETGGGTFAVFTVEADAKAYARQRQVFVVWAGRTVGIMSKRQCITATQRLDSATMRGPMAEDAAQELWSSLQAGVQVINESALSPKANNNKKKKRYCYAVAVGKVPGVYE